MADQYIKSRTGIGAGEVNGPGSSTTNALAKWGDTSGALLSDSGILIDASNNITGIGSLGGTGPLALSISFLGDYSNSIINTENTSATSSSALKLSSGGSSAGDPYIRFRILGVTASDFCIGTDNSDSDKFKICNAGSIVASTSEYFSLTTAGLITIGSSLQNQTHVVNGNISISGLVTATGGIKGSATNDSATAGNVGEYLESTSQVANVAVSGQYADIGSLALTAGDWDVSLTCTVFRGSATFSDVSMQIGIGTATGNDSAGLLPGNNTVQSQLAGISTTFTSFGLTVPLVRISLASPATYYGKLYLSTFTGSTTTTRYRLSARRVR